MQIVKCFMLLLIFISSNLIGKLIAKKYTYRLEELEEIKNILNLHMNQSLKFLKRYQKIVKKIV